jgi:NADH-ubiquinone oxidoreductase chain 1
MTEHAAVIFVFFFLAEYASIILICILTSILFLGGYLIDYTLISLIIQYSYYDYVILNIISYMSSPLIEGMIYGLTIGIKTCVMVFVFI